MPSGRYRLSEWGLGDPAWSDETLEVPAGAHASASASFRTRTLRVRVVDPTGAPCRAGIPVRLRSDHDPRTPERRIDTDGRVAFDSLGRGPWQVTLVLADGERALGEVAFPGVGGDLERTCEVR